MSIERVSGDNIHTIVTTQRLVSIREVPKNLFGLTGIDSVIFVGSTCVGKSTLERAVRTASLEDPVLKGRISVPVRVVTRPPRPDDKDVYFCSPDEFNRLILEGVLGLYGIKIMEGGRQEPYGYLKPEQETLPIFFANNQTLKNRITTKPDGVLENTLIVLIYAPDHIREERLRARSPQLFEERVDEVVFRLSKEERAIGLVSRVHLVVRNFGRFEFRSIEDVISLMRGMVIKKEM